MPLAMLVALAVAGKFGKAKKQGKQARGQASHGEHQTEPAAIGVWPLVADAAEHREGQQNAKKSAAEDGGAGAQ